MSTVPLLRDDCIFCGIVSGGVDAEILFENEDAICVLDINPIHFGHSLVIPKRHCRDFLELPASMVNGVFGAAHSVARATVIGLKLDGFNIFSNNGRIAGQSVFHFHLHITPRYRDDDIRFVLELKKYGDGEMKRYGALIRKCLSNPT
ncbi:MAG: HIT domain-containing protein [Ignavibacteriales bacterium]|nr:HIT domain-containing protein [Ignavibacteriales bacterium]